MANEVYNPSLGYRGVNWLTDDIRAILVDTSEYTFSSAHEFLSSVPALARIASANVTGRTFVDGEHRASPVAFAAVASAVQAMILYVHTGVDATARLLGYFDSADGLPVDPGGGDVTVTFSGANGVAFDFNNVVE